MSPLLSSAGTVAVPAPARLRRPRLIAYQRLLLLVGLVNLGLLWSHLARGDWSVDDGSALSGFAPTTSSSSRTASGAGRRSGSSGC